MQEAGILSREESEVVGTRGFSLIYKETESNPRPAEILGFQTFPPLLDSLDQKNYLSHEIDPGLEWVSRKLLLNSDWIVDLTENL